MARSVPPLTRLAAAGAALAVAAGAAWLALDRDAPAASRGPTGYRIGYDVTADGRTTREVVEVVGLVSRRTTTTAAGGSAATATTASGVYDRVEGGPWRQLAVVGPGEAGARLQLLPSLLWAEGLGLAERVGSATVAGTPCTWWVTREPLDAADVAAADATDRTRSCVDDRGRLLADAWTAGGRELRTRTAVEVAALDALDPFDGASVPPIDPRLVTTAVQPLAPEGAPPPGCTWSTGARVVDAVPGSTEVGRRTDRWVADCAGAVVVLDQVEAPGAAPAPRGTGGLVVGTTPARVRGTGGGVVVELVVDGRLRRLRSGVPLDDVVGWLSQLP